MLVEELVCLVNREWAQLPIPILAPRRKREQERKCLIGLVLLLFLAWAMAEVTAWAFQAADWDGRALLLLLLLREVTLLLIYVIVVVVVAPEMG